MVKVAIKFCGGCNPTFDRGEYWNRICQCAGERISWIRFQEDYDGVVLVINGCQRACPEFDLSSTAQLISIKSDKVAPDDVVCILVAREDTHEDNN